jgi:Domain of unknown function (DUF4132)
MPGDGAGWFRLVDGSTVAAPADAIVRPWHPLLADQVEIDAWADHLARRGLTQAVEQVRRPVYRLGTDEPPGAKETHRFAERIVDGRRCLRALDDARLFRSRPRSEQFEVDLHPLGDGRSVVGAVRFSVPFGRLAPLVFSEAMLDVARAIDAGSLRV